MGRNNRAIGQIGQDSRTFAPWADCKRAATGGPNWKETCGSKGESRDSARDRQSAYRQFKDGIPNVSD